MTPPAAGSRALRARFVPLSLALGLGALLLPWTHAVAGVAPPGSVAASFAASGLSLRADSVSGAAGDTVDVLVRADLTSSGKALGSFQVEVRFDPAVVSFVSLTSAGFQGLTSSDETAAATGLVRLAGINTNANANLGTTVIGVLRLRIVGAWGSQSTVGLTLSELVSVDFVNLTSSMAVLDGQVRVHPGTWGAAVRGGVELARGEPSLLTLRGFLGNLRAPVGAAQGRLTFRPGVLRVDSLRAGDFGGTFEGNVGMQIDSGFVRFAVVHTAPPRPDSADFVRIWVTPIGEGGDTTTVGVVVEEARDPVWYADLLPFLVETEGLRVSVTDGFWGDPSGDRNITALDALICLSAVVGKDVSQFDATACDVAPDDGATFIGRVTALDALAILSHVVGKTLPATFRVGRSRSAGAPPPQAPVATVAVSPATGEVMAGATLQLSATLKDVTSAVLTGRTVTWTSSNAAVATVSSAGQVTGVAAGTATITATSEGKSGSSTVTVSPPVSVPAQQFLLSAGGGHTCRVRPADGSVECWGMNGHGQLGDSTTVTRLVPTKVAGSVSFTSVSAGATHTCALTASGTPYCWGDGTGSITPVAVSGAPTLRTLSTGGNFSCGLTEDGRAYCWGENSAGQLGSGDLTSSATPRPVDQGALRFVQLTSAAVNSCAVSTLGTVHCWGADNTDGAMGFSGAAPVVRPGPVVSLPQDAGVALQVVTGGAGGMGFAHSCALTSSGRTYCWGSNPYGQLGSAAAPAGPEPNLVEGGLTFTSLVTRGVHVCALTASGAAYCWGYNNPEGAVGDGSVENRRSPTPVAGGLSFAQVAAGGHPIFGHHSCGLTPAGTVYCWGGNAHGQLGDGTTHQREVPTFVTGSAADYSGQDLSGLDLGGLDFSGANLTGANLSSSRLAGVSLTNANLTNADARDANLQGAVLTGAAVSGVMWTGARFNGSSQWPTGFDPSGKGMWGPGLDYSGLDLSHRYLGDNELQGADFTGANLSFSTLHRVDFRGATLTDANLTGALLHGAHLLDASLSGVTWNEARFDRGTTWPSGFDPLGRGMFGPGEDLSGRDLSGRNLHNVDLKDAKLVGANLSGASVTTSGFDGADLTGANLSAANLSASNFTNANLTNADLTDALLYGVVFTGATVTGVQWTGARYDGQTVWPAGFDPEGKGMIGPGGQ